MHRLYHQVVSTVATLLDHCRDVIVGLGVGLQPGGFRRPLEREPLGAAHRRFTVRSTAARISRQTFGDGTVPVLFDVAVRVAYARLGGDAGVGVARGDIRGVNETAGGDLQLASDALTDVRTYNRAVTEIREIRFRGISRPVAKPHIDVWQLALTCEVLYVWPA